MWLAPRVWVTLTRAKFSPDTSASFLGLDGSGSAHLAPKETDQFHGGRYKPYCVYVFIMGIIDAVSSVYNMQWMCTIKSNKPTCSANPFFALKAATSLRRRTKWKMEE